VKAEMLPKRVNRNLIYTSSEGVCKRRRTLERRGGAYFLSTAEKATQ